VSINGWLDEILTCEVGLLFGWKIYFSFANTLEVAFLRLYLNMMYLLFLMKNVTNPYVPSLKPLLT